MVFKCIIYPLGMGIKQTFVVVIDGAIINSTMQLIMLQANEKHCITRKYHVPPHRRYVEACRAKFLKIPSVDLVIKKYLNENLKKY